MDEINTLMFYIFILSLVLLVAVYYVGVKTDVASFSTAINSLVMVGTGRNPVTGAFANYPK